jgi:glycosyltransferase involved in cell wall biosynthesis
MHVLFDSQIFALQTRGGISRYFVELAHRLPLLDPDIRTTVLAPLHINSCLVASPARKRGRKIVDFRGRHRILPLLNRTASRLYLQRHAPDIFHETYFSLSGLPVSAPRVLTVYDMIHERFPEYFHGIDRRVHLLKKKAVARADHVIAISRVTADDLVHFLDVAPHKITVIPLASSLGTGRVSRMKVMVEINGQRPYVLYVGQRGGVKNFQRFIRAVAQSRLLCSEFDVVCVGGGCFTPGEKRFFADQGMLERVRHRQADDIQLARLYAGAALFVYPSLYEGFGLPLLEAMGCGCPVACSRTGSMPEIAGEAALYFDPTDVEEMSTVIQSAVLSADRADTLRVLGYEREKKFSWQLCTERTAEVYRSLAAG